MVDKKKHQAFIKLCEERNINPELFFPEEASSGADNDLSRHVEWVYENIYSIPYPPPPFRPHWSPIPRAHHGMACST